MKTFFILLSAVLVLLWFANESIQGVGLMFYNGEKWTTTHFIGWKLFMGTWFLFLAVAAATALFFAGLVAWLRFDFESREKELRAELEKDKKETIAGIVKNLNDKVNSLGIAQANVAELNRRLLEMEKRHSDEISRKEEVLKGKHEQIRRLERKIKHLKSSF